MNGNRQIKAVFERANPVALLESVSFRVAQIMALQNDPECSACTKNDIAALQKAVARLDKAEKAFRKRSVALSARLNRITKRLYNVGLLPFKG